MVYAAVREIAPVITRVREMAEEPKPVKLYAVEHEPEEPEPLDEFETRVYAEVSRLEAIWVATYGKHIREADEIKNYWNGVMDRDTYRGFIALCDPYIDGAGAPRRPAPAAAR